MLSNSACIYVHLKWLNHCFPMTPRTLWLTLFLESQIYNDTENALTHPVPWITDLLRHRGRTDSPCSLNDWFTMTPRTHWLQLILESLLSYDTEDALTHPVPWITAFLWYRGRTDSPCSLNDCFPMIPRKHWLTLFLESLIYNDTEDEPTHPVPWIADSLWNRTLTLFLDKLLQILDIIMILCIGALGLLLLLHHGLDGVGVDLAAEHTIVVKC